MDFGAFRKHFPNLVDTVNELHSFENLINIKYPLIIFVNERKNDAWKSLQLVTGFALKIEVCNIVEYRFTKDGNCREGEALAR